jgi:putative addiction module killer protein
LIFCIPWNTIKLNVGSVGEDVSELRIEYGPGFRVYFKQVNDVLVVLLGGGDKST